MNDRESGSRYDAMGIPGLLRRARKAYGHLVSRAFADAGFDDMPRNGAYVLARVYDDRSAPADLVRELGISKQAVSQLIDTMVICGYLARTPDTEDRRRMVLTLTPRGEAAATVSWQAASRADTELAGRLSADGVAALRAGLITLCLMADETDAAASRGEHGKSEPSDADHGQGAQGHDQHIHDRQGA